MAIKLGLELAELNVVLNTLSQLPLNQVEGLNVFKTTFNSANSKSNLIAMFIP